MKRRKITAFLLILVIVLTSATFAQDLENGDKGKDVTTLQNQLKALGYFSGEATGYFGPATEKALKVYQAEHGIIATGIFGDITKKSLAKALAAKGLDKNALASRGTAERKPTPMAKAEDNAGTALVTTVGNGQTDSQAGNTAESKETKGSVELLDWWTEVGKVFPREAVAVVYDIETGKRFNIKRTYGSNHADCETLTKEDTAIMKEVWGGQWSWDRRPVLVEIDGRRLAASMTGMPHAGLDSEPMNAYVKNRSQGFGDGVNLDTVKGNDMDGHFDIHFLNSRTHGTNKVDQKHQAVVMEASKAK